MDGEEIIAEDDADDLDPGGTGAGIPTPGEIQAEPGFLVRFSTRLNLLLNDDNPNFSEFESLCEDLMISLKKELNFKSSSTDGAARPYKPVNIEDLKELQKLYRKNRKKALRNIYQEE